MSAADLKHRLDNIRGESLPLPGNGRTAERHCRLLEFGQEDLSFARLAEAHFDAISILAEAGRQPEPHALYGVWASEKPGQELKLEEASQGWVVRGTKNFCSGAGIVDRALVTVEAPNPYLVDVDLRRHPERIKRDTSDWKASGFSLTNTAAVTFLDAPIERDAIVGERGFYLTRPGFWHGACGPAACWAGGAVALVEYARMQTRSDPHTMAHLGAMVALDWSMRTLLEGAGREIDRSPSDSGSARIRALGIRHLIEQACSEIVARFGRAYGPHPLAFVAETANRIQELTIYLRQCHAERDLAALGEAVTSA